jgi:anti-anti-sigma factor
MPLGRNAPRQWHLASSAVTENGSTVLILQGRIGQAAAGDLEAAAKAALSGGIRDLVLDLSGVDYLSSAGLKVLQGLAAAQNDRGAKLVLRAPSPAARLSLDLSGLPFSLGG